MLKIAAGVFLLLFLAISAYADIPPVDQVPQLNRRVQVNGSNPMNTGRLYIRWWMDDGRRWCTYASKDDVRRVVNEQLEQLLATRPWNAASWVDVSSLNVFLLGPLWLDPFTLGICNSWVPP